MTMKTLKTRCMAVSLILAAASPALAIAQQAKVREPVLRSHLAFLADDLLEGRGTGQRGGDLAVRYLETQASLIGLQKLNAKGVDGYRQAVKLTGSQTLPDSRVIFNVKGQQIIPQWGSQIVFGSSGGKADVAFDAPVVFVGYGVRSAEDTGMILKALI